jgi:hypothetical protein
MGLNKPEIIQWSSSAFPLTFGHGISDLSFKEKISIKWGDVFKEMSALHICLLLSAYFFFIGNQSMKSPKIFPHEC